MAIFVVIGLTFLLTTLLLAFLALWFVLRPLAEHMKENSEGAAALSQHVLVPLFGKRQEGAEPGAGPEPQNGSSALDAGEVRQCKPSSRR
jgi:hypothetical protein